MIYNHETPVAVFLGPSLELEQARTILPANYYPPVRLGDVYRLLATGVKMIIIIDGVFYTSTPVWQREILSALESGITVVGGVSMGALRAAELAPYGMIGYGKIYSWYSDGVIEGDDEVALLHSDVDWGYRSFSESLVNIRHNLDNAYQQGIINANQNAEMINFLKHRCFSERSYDLLFKSQEFKKLEPSTQTDLQRFIEEKAENLKRIDAVETLRYCVSLVEKDIPSGTITADTRISAQKVHEMRMRSALLPSGILIPLQSILTEVMKDENRAGEMMKQVVRQFYLMQWINWKEINPPVTYVEEYFSRWCGKLFVPEEKEIWLKRNGLKADEYKEEITVRASITWILEQGPSAFGIKFEKQTTTTIAVFSSKMIKKSDVVPDHEDRMLEAMENSFICDWARSMGIDCPEELINEMIMNWLQHTGIKNLNEWLREQNLSERAFYTVLSEYTLTNWLVKNGPQYSGYDKWSSDMALIKELQVTGFVARSAQAMGED